jgi:hypothetical protein
MCMGVLGLDWYRVSGGYSIELASCATSRAQSGNLGTWTSEVVDAPDELFYQAERTDVALSTKVVLKHSQSLGQRLEATTKCEDSHISQAIELINSLGV